MVLISRRAACVAACVATLGASLAAQQPQTPQTPQSAQLRRGEEHPLLFGFALECAVNCAPGERARGRSGGGGTGAPLAHEQFPHVIAVAPGSAAEKAGIHPGDVLQSIDGASVITEAGAARLANAKAGETVKLEFERAGRSMAIPLLLGETSNPANASMRQRIFGGYAAIHGEHVHGNLDIEIWSDEPIVPSDSTGTVIMRIGTSTLIKMRLAPDSADTSRTGRGGAGDSLKRAPQP